jgi:hypothetical protein
LEQDKAPVEIDELSLAVFGLAHDGRDVAGEDRRLGFDSRSAVIADAEQAKHGFARPRH